MNSKQLWTRYADGDDDARQQLLNEHLGLVYFVARKIAGGLTADVQFEELVSAGTLGLMNALESFDPSRGLAFSTYAAPRIRGAALDELRRQDYVPRSVRRKTREMNAASEAVGRKVKHQPTDREMAKQLGVDVETLWRWQADVEGAVHISLDRTANTEDSALPSPVEMLCVDTSDDIEEKINLDQEVGLLREALLLLSEQERTVLTLYYFEDLKLHEIAKILELSESRVSQIRSKALASLRQELSPCEERA
ncbi:MAG: sigma-70 family RNA polymerase sigma factor [Gemmatimonadales bacterium]